MTTSELLDILHQRGVNVSMAGGDIFVKPWSAVPDELRTLIREMKPGLLELLSPDPADVFYPRDHYNPALARIESGRHPEGSHQRRELLRYADEALAERSHGTVDVELAINNNTHSRLLNVALRDDWRTKDE